MKTLKSVLFLCGAGLVLAGILSFFLQPGPPESECVPNNAASSGFVDEKKDCAISQESWKEISDYETSPKPFRILGLLLILAGLVVLVVAVIRTVRSKGSDGPVSQQ